MKIIKTQDALNLKNTIFIDVRTESEYKEDRICNAINIPIFTDDEHKKIGTIYKQEGKEKAIDEGFDYISPKLKSIYRQVSELSKKYDNIVIYCARGGMRSGSISSLLSSIGVDIYKLEGGYKSYRNYVINYLENIMNEKSFVVLHGLTGVGKTDLLNDLEQKGMDVIDLEGIAKNTGSTFGFITFKEKPPTQKKFESEIFEKIYFSGSDYIFIESESKRVGHVIVPNEIYDGITRDGYHLLIECSMENRVNRLAKDYINGNEENIDDLKGCIVKFKKRLGNDKVTEYINMLDNKEYKGLVNKYLVEYYDPLYMHSVDKYKYNKTIISDDINTATDEIIKFHQSITKGEIKC